MTAASASRVAVVQHCAGQDVARNLDVLEHFSRQAAAVGAEVICWPEAFAYLGPHSGKLDMVEPLPEGGPILQHCQQLAATLQCELLLGGFHEAAPQDPQRCFNTSVYLGRNGEVQATYRKIHLFDVQISDGPTLQESRNTLPGERCTTTQTRFGTLGLTVCYDLRFPQLYQNLTDMGAIAHSVPSAFTAHTGAMHWHPLLRARAIENLSFIIAPAQCGRHSEHRASYGHSLIVDPWGRILAKLGDEEGYAIATIDPQVALDARQEIPSLSNRQPLR